LWELRIELVVPLLEALLGNSKTKMTAEFISDGMLEGGQVGSAPVLIAAEAVKEADQLGSLAQSEAMLETPLREKANNLGEFCWVEADIQASGVDEVAADLAGVTVGCVELVLTERVGYSWVRLAEHIVEHESTGGDGAEHVLVHVSVLAVVHRDEGTMA
jgi:hypothetical protein